MPEFKRGDRVRWIHREPGADEAELRGTVVDTADAAEPQQLLVAWDAGFEDWESSADFRPEG